MAFHFNKEKIQTEQIQSNLNCFVGQKFNQEKDIIREQLYTSLEGYIYTRSRPKQRMSFQPKRQKFWAYIFGKKPETFEIEVSVKDVLNPPPNIDIPMIAIMELNPINLEINNSIYP